MIKIAYDPENIIIYPDIYVYRYTYIKELYEKAPAVDIDSV